MRQSSEAHFFEYRPRARDGNHNPNRDAMRLYAEGSHDPNRAAAMFSPRHCCHYGARLDEPRHRIRAIPIVDLDGREHMDVGNDNRLAFGEPLNAPNTIVRGVHHIVLVDLADLQTRDDRCREHLALNTMSLGPDQVFLAIQAFTFVDHVEHHTVEQVS